jgi:hypothetical protein
MTNVVVTRQKKVVVTQKANTQQAIDSSYPITIKNTTGFTALNFRIDRLSDVYEPPTVANGHTLVYHSANDTYVVQQLEIGEVGGVDTLNIDGGTF